MSEHFIEKCKCGIVINQCRCVGGEKAVRIVPCPHPEPPTREHVERILGNLKALHDYEENCNHDLNVLSVTDAAQRLTITRLERERDDLQDQLTEAAQKHLTALSQLAAMTKERDDWQRKYTLVLNDPEYAQCCNEREKVAQQLAAMTRDLDQAKGNYAIQKAAADDMEAQWRKTNAQYESAAKAVTRVSQERDMADTERIEWVRRAQRAEQRAEELQDRMTELEETVRKDGCV